MQCNTFGSKNVVVILLQPVSRTGEEEVSKRSVKSKNLFLSSARVAGISAVTKGTRFVRESTESCPLLLPEKFLHETHRNASAVSSLYDTRLENSSLHDYIPFTDVIILQT